MNRSRLASIFMVVFIDLLGFGLILPLLPFYAGSYGASDTLVGLLVAIYALAQLFGAPFLGRLSDRFGRRPILMVSILGTAISFLMLALAEPLGRWLAGSVLSPMLGGAPAGLTNGAILGVLFFSRFFAGLTGGNITVAQAYISDVTDAQNRARGFGLLGAAFGLGFILGPAIGAVLSRWGYATPSFAASGLATVNLILVSLFLTESLPKERRAGMAHQRHTLISVSALLEALARPRTGPLMQIRLFYALAAALFQSIFTLWAKERLGLTAQATGYLFAYVGALSVIVQGGIIGRLTQRFSEARLIFSTTILLALSLLAWAFTSSVVLLVVVMAPLAFSFGVLNTVINSAITRAVLPQEVGGALGTAASLESFSRVVSPSAGGWLLDRVGTWAPGATAAAIMVGVVFLTWRRLLVNPDPPLAMVEVPAGYPPAASH